jgi:hypothetical protein
MLRHPGPWLGLALSLWWGVESVRAERWSGAADQGLVANAAPLLLGVSLASASAFGREQVPVADDAPMTPSERSAARLLGGLPLVLLVLVVVAVTGTWLRLSGGLPLGDEPGRTLHAQYTWPELLQPVLLAGVAVTVGAAAAHLIRQRLATAVVLFLGWFLVSVYWVFNGPVARMLTPLQVQPLEVEIGPVQTDPTTFPASWLLAAPGDYRDHWARVVVSPQLAAWHDLYLVAVTALLAAIAVPGRWRRGLLVVAGSVAVLAVLAQLAVTP